jgi:mRNA interferase MazF
MILKTEVEDIKFGDIVLLKFPFVDGITFKKRPALVIQASEDNDLIVCRITSQLYNTAWDVPIKNWEESGLKLPSIIRVHKIATLEMDLVELRMGNIDESLKQEVMKIFAALPK